METNIEELNTLLEDLDAMFVRLIKLGISFENKSQYEKALCVYQKGLEKSKRATTDISDTMIGLFDN
jgi:hypothetical protein